MAAKPYFWALVERVAPMVVSFLVSIVVARMVAPAAYGLVAMLSLFMALGQAFTELGFGAALVQRRQVDADDETTVFVINVVAGAAISGVLCAISPLIAHLLQQPILVSLLCAQSIGILIASTGLVQFARLSRHMEFRLGAVIELIGTCVSGFVGVAMAWRGFGVWSLVGLALSRELARVVAAWALIGWRPTGRFHWSRAREMWAYSGRLLYSSLMHRVVTNLYSILIGRVYAPAALGLYTRAIGLQALPSGVIVGIVQRVAFPLYSRGQDDPAQLLRTLRRQVRILTVLVAVAMGGLAAVAGELVPWMLGERWLGAVPLLKILCIAGVLSSIFPLHSQMTMALGESGIFLKVELLKKIAIVLVLALIYRFGLRAFAWGAVATSVADYMLSAWPVRRLLGYSWRMQARDIVPPALLCAIPALPLASYEWQGPVGDLPLMVAKGVVFVAVVGAGLWVLRKTVFVDAWSIARPKQS